MSVNRRDFIKGSTVAGLSLALGCAGVEAPAAFGDIPLGQVTLVRADTAADAIARGAELMAGLSFIEPGQRVLLKPNLTGPIQPPDVTSPRLLMALIEQCRAAGAGEVVVAERTFGPLNTDEVFESRVYEEGTLSMLDAVILAGGTFLPLDEEPWVEVQPADAVDLTGPILIPSVLDEVDHVINVPALKTHELAVFTMTMKNLFGLVHPDSREAQFHGHAANDADPDRFYRVFAQMNLAFAPTLNVMDALVSRTTGGPTPPGDVAETNLVLFGRDRVAMDAVGLAILKVYGTEPHIEDRPVWEQVQLAEAVRLGFGVSGPDDVTLVGDGVDELDAIDAALRET